MPAPISADDRSRDQEALLDAAEVLFHAPRIQAVGMDAIREAAGMALKQIHGLFATKEELVIAVLRRRDQRWRASLADHVESHDDPRERVLSVFDWLEQWFAEPGFRGCAWINAYGELGGISPPVLAEVRAHKHAFHQQVTAWVESASPMPAEPVFLIAEGAIVTASTTGDASAARSARTAVEALIG